MLHYTAYGNVKKINNKIISKRYITRPRIIEGMTDTSVDNTNVDTMIPSGFKLVTTGQPVEDLSQEECKAFTDKLDGYSFTVINESGNPKGCMLQDGTPPGSKGVYYNAGGTANCGVFNGVSKCVVKDTTNNAASSAKIKLSINGRWNSDITKEFDDKPEKYTVDESPAYPESGSMANKNKCYAKDKCVVEINDKSQARIRMLDRCESVQGNHLFSDYIGVGETIEKDGCSITKFASIHDTPASAASATNSTAKKDIQRKLSDENKSLDIKGNLNITGVLRATQYANFPKDNRLEKLKISNTSNESDDNVMLEIGDDISGNLRFGLNNGYSQFESINLGGSEPQFKFVTSKTKNDNTYEYLDIATIDENKLLLPKSLCLGETCINEEQLKKILGETN